MSLCGLRSLIVLFKVFGKLFECEKVMEKYFRHLNATKSFPNASKLLTSFLDTPKPLTCFQNASKLSGCAKASVKLSESVKASKTLLNTSKVLKSCLKALSKTTKQIKHIPDSLNLFQESRKPKISFKPQNH
jgi:hypothetical protein